MHFCKFPPKKKAQQIIEFAFVAPILILVLLTIMEFGYAMFIRNAVSDGTRSVLIEVNKFNNLTGDAVTKKSNMETNIKNSLVNYLTVHNVPNASNIAVSINTDINGVSTVSVSYLYRPALLTPFIAGMPTILLQSSQIINSAMLKENTFDNLTTEQLSSIFPIPDGAVKSPTIDGYNIRKNIAILVSWYDDYDLTNVTSPVYAKLFSWYGDDLLPSNLRVNVRTATLEVRSPYYNNGNWFDTKVPYVWVVSALGYTHVYFVKYNSTNDTASGAGYTLNTCNVDSHYTADGGVDLGLNDCPLGWGGQSYYYLYKINPIAWFGGVSHDNFKKAFGYRWCNTGATSANCDGDLTGTLGIHELALKGISKEGWYCTNHNIDYHYNLLGNYENINNATNVPVLSTYIYNLATYIIGPAPDKLDMLQHYTTQTTNKLNFDGNYIVNIWQPTINYYYTSASLPVDPAKLNDNAGPLYSAFQWKFHLSNAGIFDSLAAPNTDIVDVYIDSDGDGVPDAWDDDPAWFDRDDNGTPDGLQLNLNCDHHDNGQHHSDCHVDNTNATIIDPDLTAYTSYSFPVTGIGSQIISTPFDVNGTLRDSVKSNVALKSYVPQLTYSDFRKATAPPPNGIYVLCSANVGAANDLCRKVTIWDVNAANRLNQKLRFIYGHVCGSDICLDKSPELDYLDTNKFAATNKFTRKPPAVW